METSSRSPACSRAMATQAVRPPNGARSCSIAFCILFNHPFQAPDNLIQARIVVVSVSPKAIDGHAIVALALGVDVFVIVDGHANVRDFLAAEENQIARAHLGTLDGVEEKAILLITIARKIIAAHA